MKTLWEGLFKRNPVFVLLFGLVPAVAITTTAINGWFLGVITSVIFLLTTVINYFVIPRLWESLRPVVKIAIVILFTVVIYTIVLEINPQVVASLGIFLPLIAVNAMVLQDPDENKTFGLHLLEALGQSLGFILAMVVLGIIREFLGYGAVFGYQITNASLAPLSLATSVPGGMIIVGLALAIVNKVRDRGGELHD
ncbi:MAG: Rnf-Nqr domain containing protein [Bacillota bacterium]|nr:Rnf-Nqr domain containing protein [Bacillota bacterium]HHU61806.1 hypothetical protein [Natronincola sp.]